MTDLSSFKVPPHDLLAESSVIGSMLTRSDTIPQVKGLLDPQDFYRKSHGSIVQAIFELDGKADVVTVADWLSKKDLLEKCGGNDYFFELTANVISSSVLHHCKIVKILAQKRGMIRLCQQTMQACWRKSTDFGEVTLTHDDEFQEIMSGVKKEKHQEVGLTHGLREFLNSNMGTTIHLRDAYSFQQIQQLKDKKKIQSLFNRFCKEGILERTGKMAGQYHIVDTDIKTIDFQNEQGDFLDIRYPFGIERFIRTMPGNVLVLAGSPDAGKTALLLNFIKLNQNRDIMPIHYFSSEMGAMELRSRLIEFEDIPMEDWNFTAQERAGNFADVIQPNAINVIDFLEISDAFYQIGQMLTDVHNKLDKGIAFLAIQKDPKGEYGRGASFSLEKPRLYLTVDQDFPGQVLRIKKAKNWRDSTVNPNGQMIHFAIRSGCNLIPKSDWDKEEREKWRQ